MTPLICSAYRCSLFLVVENFIDIVQVEEWNAEVIAKNGKLAYLKCVMRSSSSSVIVHW